jgi:DNA-binding NarL/FixJ family response regulator
MITWKDGLREVARTDTRILVADSNAIDRQGLARLIEREQGFTIVGEAANLSELVQQCRTLAPDVTVVAMGLAEPHEEAVIPRLLRAEPQLRIVALSDRGATQCVVLNPPSRLRDVAKPAPSCPVGTDCLTLAAAQGARATVRRDADPEDLFRAIRAAAAGQSWYDSRTAANLATGGSTAESRFDRGLSPRELDVAALLAEGLSNKEISTALSISEPTVKKHVGHILGKLGLQDRLQAGLHIARNPLIVARRTDLRRRHPSAEAARPAGALAVDQHERQAVVALSAHGLERGGADTRLGRDAFVHAAHALDCGIGALRVDHVALADHVVDDDHRSRPRKPERPGEVVGKARLVRIDEH